MPSFPARRSWPACRAAIGQQAAVEAMADVVSIAKARLNDRQRPLGTLFFLGPTGVGKTECAKALAHYLFGDAAPAGAIRYERVRLAASGGGLVGTFDRRRVCSPAPSAASRFACCCSMRSKRPIRDVFDLLLQIMGKPP